MQEYSTKTIADIVGISASRLRYYAQVLEKAGHNISRNDRGHRIFTEMDIPLFQEMKKQFNDTGMNVEQIALELVTNQNSHSEPEENIPSTDEINVENEVETEDVPQSDEGRYKELLDEINTLKQLIANQQKYIDERFEQQRDLKSLELIRKSQEIKKADLELAAAQESEKKSGFFRKLFKW